MLKLQNITAGYGGSPILHDISLSFPPGTLTAIVGPNGCGKTTLLKTAAGLLTPSGGTLLAPEPRSRHIAYLPQTRPLPEMTALRLVLHGRFPWLSWLRRYGPDDEAIARSALRQMGVEDLAEQPLSALSGGTRQKVYLAMALAQDAGTILLDEPTSFLDIGAQLELMKLLKDLASQGRAVAAVLHDLPLALSQADRIAVLEEGRLLALDTPRSLCASGLLDRVFGIRILPLPTPAGTQYVCLPK